MVPGASIVKEVSMVTAGMIVGGEYGTVCIIVIGIDDGVRTRVRACLTADYAACVAID